MKRSILALLSIVLVISGISGNWMKLRSDVPVDAKLQVVSSTLDHSTVKITLGGFDLREVQTPTGPAYIVAVGEGTPLLVSGAPDLPKLTSTLVIPDLAEMKVNVVSSVYRDFTNISIAPSKGVLTRDIDPSTVPYQYGPVYAENKFFPESLIALRDPFISRDLRGQTVIIHPFQYNPVTKTLRVFEQMTVELSKVSDNGTNPLIRAQQQIMVSPEWESIFSRAFDNFDAVTYTALEEYGKMLILCHDDFMTSMQPFVDWKNASGIPTEMVDVAVAGTTAAAIKTYIANYYNTNTLTFVLLVGDNAQIPTNMGGGLGGPSDNAYGYITGNDHYGEVFVGRFSAENTAHVETQVERTLNYETDPQLITDDWYTSVIGIASNQGPGDDGEYDYQHVRNMQDQLLQYTYTWNPELFDGSQGGNDAGGNPTPAQVATEVNAGASLILYTGHGSMTSWGTSGFNNNNVNSLVNQDKLPFIWSVACVNGDFQNGTCFAEAWLRAVQNGEPTGAIGFLGATINQSWNPPMEGQDEMVDILAEAYPSNIKRTFGGLSINGCFQMIEAYGTDGQNMADTWTIFGDPSLMVRTDNPEPMTVTYDPTLFVGATSLTVNCNVDGARATATLNGTILDTDIIAGGSVVLNFAPLPNPQDSVHVVVTAYNYIPHQGDIPVITPSGPYITYISNTVNDLTGNNDQVIDYGEDILLTVNVKNLGIEATANLTVTVSTADPYINQTDSTEFYGVVNPNEVKNVPDAYAFHVSSNIPDGHSIPFVMHAVDGSNTWNSSFSITAHSPALALTSYIVLDPSGNNNGRLDPGETATLQLTVENSGSSEAFNVIGNLVSISPWVTVTTTDLSYGDLTSGQSSANNFEVVVDDDAPEGQAAPFMLELSADRGVATAASFELIIGKLPLLVVDFDGNANSGTAVQTAAQSLGLLTNYSLAMPDDLDQYSSVFVCLGIYPDGYVLTSADGQKMKEYLEAGGRAYMEGGDTWNYDPATPVHPLFHILGFQDGSGDLEDIQGFAGTFTEGMLFNYTGDNQYIDRLAAEGTAWTVFKNADPMYHNAIAYDGGAFRTVGTSFEFGGLADGAFPSTKLNLMKKYLEFFGIDIPSLNANFAGYPTSITPGGNVNFTDFSTGPVTSRVWSFPGGNPSTSTEENPVVFYNTLGDHDVQLIVSNGIDSDTLLKTAYIHVDDPVGTQVQEQALSASVIPNPNNGSFWLKVSVPQDERLVVRMYSLIGTVVYQETISTSSQNLMKQINLNLPDGIYILNIQGISSTITKRVIVTK